MRKKIFFICFTGIDGSGKTTLAKMTVEILLHKGISCENVYNRFIPFLSKPFIGIGKKLFMARKDIYTNYEKNSQAKEELLKNKMLSFFYQFFILGDYFFQILFKITLRLILGKNIVCDRYIYDTIITDLALSVGYSGQMITNILKKCFYFVPKPDLVFLVDAPAEIAYHRKNDIPSVDYLRARREIYLNIGKSEGMMILDGVRNIAELMSEVKTKIDESLLLESV